MPVAEWSETPAADAEPETSGRRHRSGLLTWRIGAGLCLIALCYLWIRSWHRIDHALIPAGSVSGDIELCLAGSSVAFSFLGSDSQSIQFGNAGPIGQKHLIPYQVLWPDGDTLGTAANPCVFPPEAGTISQIDFDRVGSFGAMLTKLPTPAGSEIFVHFRIPLWFVVTLLIATWFWIERSARRSRRKATVQS